MTHLQTIRLGTKNLLLHKLRSALTILGIVLGVGSVIAMLAIGEGSKRAALEQIRQLGATNVIIRSVKPGEKAAATETPAGNAGQRVSRVAEFGLKYDDYDRLTQAIPTLRGSLAVSLLRKDARHGSRLIANARVLGTTPECLDVKRLTVKEGRFLIQADIDRTANVVVLASGAAERLFGFENPLDAAVLLGPDVYRVVGVLAPRGLSGDQDANQDVYIPLSAARLRFGELQIVRSSGSLDFERTQLSEITLTVRDETQVHQTAEMARELLTRHHRLAVDYEIQVPLELLEQAEREKWIWNLVLGSIAGISLVVGGVGIMNIMLASVTERTREIGIRRALGAKRRDITVQFLVESAVLSSTGGLLGVILGVAIPLAVTYLAKIETVLSGWSIALSFGISLLTGVVFGLYPARRAAAMNPIQALRHVA